MFRRVSGIACGPMSETKSPKRWRGTERLISALTYDPKRHGVVPILRGKEVSVRLRLALGVPERPCGRSFGSQRPRVSDLCMRMASLAAHSKAACMKCKSRSSAEAIGGAETGG